MRITGSIEILKPRELVTEIFINPENLKEYQDGFEKKELVSGNPGQEGAVSKMFYKYGGREMEMTETITSNNLPDSFEAHYHHKDMDNTMKCAFYQVSADSTQYSYEIEYTRLNWIMPRLMATLFPGVYRKPIEKWMKQFKEFVESQ